MYIEQNTLLLLAIIITLVSGISISSAITKGIKLKWEHQKYLRLKRHYTSLYNKHYEATKKSSHTYYQLEIEYINRYPEAIEYKWLSSPEEVKDEIAKHNILAKLVRNRLKALGLATDNQKLETDLMEIYDEPKKIQQKRNEWYEATNKIADGLNIKYPAYGYTVLPLDTSECVENEQELYSERTVNISVKGVEDLLNKVANTH